MLYPPLFVVRDPNKVMIQTEPNPITLEPRTTAHAEELFAILSEQKLYEFLDEEAPQSVEALKQKLARSESRKSPDGTEHWLNWVVRDASRQMIGYVQTTIFANGEANVAYVIGSAYWGHGLAYQAVDQMISIVAAQFGVRVFFITTERENTRSVCLAERLGFARVTADVTKQRKITASELLMRRVDP
jgi:[ribosomal protein S5]-alanine N-acetyltransferase